MYFSRELPVANFLRDVSEHFMRTGERHLMYVTAVGITSMAELQYDYSDVTAFFFVFFFD